MTKKDLFTFILLTVGSVLGILLFEAIKRNKLGPKKWPRVFGVGAGIFMFISLIIAREMFMLTSELFGYMIRSFLLSLALGIITWLGARSYVQCKK